MAATCGNGYVFDKLLKKEKIYYSAPEPVIGRDYNMIALALYFVI